MEYLMSENRFENEYSENGFWDKAKKFGKAAGESVLGNALNLFYASKDPDTPAWAKTAVYGALGYFISPLDAIPDVTPFVGFSDDLGVLVAATAAIAAHITGQHKEQSKKMLEQWFGH
jgi:uncharacterized membrane protein YkvA (DUF1232 family)